MTKDIKTATSDDLAAFYFHQGTNNRAYEYLGCHPCINTSTLRIAMSDVLQKLIPAMGHEPTFVTLPWNPEE